MANAPSCTSIVPCNRNNGEGEVAAATNTSNTVCEACTFGYTYAYVAPGATVPKCAPLKKCATGMEEAIPPTTSSDRQCTACPTGRFRDASMLADPASKCQAWAICVNVLSEVSLLLARQSF